jgi:hypothetical protein
VTRPTMEDMEAKIVALMAKAIRRARRSDLRSARDIAALDAAPLQEDDLKLAKAAFDAINPFVDMPLWDDEDDGE